MPRLVFLPGLINDARLWQNQIDGLNGVADCSVDDLTGHDSIAALAASVLEQAPSTHFALAGLSMGGYVALEVMRQAPERVTALALLDTSARPDTPQATEGRRAAIALSETDYPAFIAALYSRLVNARHGHDPELSALFAAMAHSVGQPAFTRQQTAILGRIDNRPLLGAINCPTLVLWGAEDAVTPLEVHAEMAAAIPEATLSILPDCGHLSALEQPASVTAALHAWLKKLP